MKSLPRWVRLLLWLCGADFRELSEPSPMLLPVEPPTPAPARAAPPLDATGPALLARLISLDGLLAVAFGVAVLNPFNGHVCRATDRTWLQ